MNSAQVEAIWQAYFLIVDICSHLVQIFKESAANRIKFLNKIFASSIEGGECVFKDALNFPGYAAAISNVEQIQEDREERRMVHAVRNFVEKIVDGLVENVDDTPIDRLYEDSECKQTIACNSNWHHCDGMKL